MTGATWMPPRRCSARRSRPASDWPTGSASRWSATTSPSSCSIAATWPRHARELEAALATARELGDRLEVSNSLSDLGFVEAAAGTGERAAALQGEALGVAARIGAKGIVAQSIDGIAGLVAAEVGWPRPRRCGPRPRRSAGRLATTSCSADRRRIGREIAPPGRGSTTKPGGRRGRPASS